jgi:hypothetical protein
MALSPGTTLTREQCHAQREARRDPSGVPLHAPDLCQALVSEPTLGGLPHVQRQVETGKAVLGVDVSVESSGADTCESLLRDYFRIFVRYNRKYRQFHTISE